MNKYFNRQGEDTNLIVGNHTGIVNFNDSSLVFANKHYVLMNNLFWLPTEIDCSNEAKAYMTLSDNEKMVYKLVFSNLSFLDSVQESHVLDFRQNTTHRIIRSALTAQSFQESIHSQSYATVLTELGAVDEVMHMYKTEQILLERNEKISELFASNIRGNSTDDLLTSAIASILLEGILFLTSFTYVYILGNTMQGSSSMVQKINADEDVHMSMFANIFNTIKKQGKVSNSTIEKCYNIIDEAVQLELQFGKYICDNYPIMGINYNDIKDTVYNYANKRLKIIGFNPVYKSTKPKSTLQVVAERFSKVNDSKSNFFEASVKNYSKGSIDLDDF